MVFIKEFVNCKPLSKVVMKLLFVVDKPCFSLLGFVFLVVLAFVKAWHHFKDQRRAKRIFLTSMVFVKAMEKCNLVKISPKGVLK